jgi:hypothetical protein
MSDAVSLTGPQARETDGGKGLPGDRTGRGAGKVVDAQLRLDEAKSWAAVFERTDKDFPPGSAEHKIVHLHYICGWTLKEIAGKMYFDRQTITRRRDNYIYRAAWYAAEAGLTRRGDK